MKIECVKCESKECFDCPTNMKAEALYFNSSKGAQLFILDGVEIEEEIEAGSEVEE